LNADILSLVDRRRRDLKFSCPPGGFPYRASLLNRLASYFLLFVFFSLGTGLAGYVHELQHDAEDAREDAAAAAARKPVVPHHHDETNCAVHAQLHMPMVAVGWVPVVVGVLLPVAFVTLVAESVSSARALIRTDCRGPPGG
jgi:hypothetical protein